MGVREVVKRLRYRHQATLVRDLHRPVKLLTLYFEFPTWLEADTDGEAANISHVSARTSIVNDRRLTTTLTRR